MSMPATIPIQTFDMVMKILADRSEIEFSCREKALQHLIQETERQFQSTIISFQDLYNINVIALRLGSQIGDDILDSLRALKLTFPVFIFDERKWEERIPTMHAFNAELEEEARTLEDIQNDIHQYEYYLDIYLYRHLEFLDDINNTDTDNGTDNDIDTD